MSPGPESRAAIIGAGLMGRWHADAVRRIGGRVTVIVDPDDEARAALARRHPHASVLAELDPLLVARHATVAHVCTPLPTHAAVVTALLGAGVHVLAEKPLTDTADTTATLLSLATGRGVLLCPVHQFGFQDGVQQLLRWIPEMGQIRRVEFSAISAGAASDRPADLDALIGEILPHPLTLIATFFPVSTARLAWQVVHPSAGELRAIASVEGAVVDIAISARGRPTENMLRVVADRCTASADLFHGFAVRHSPEVSRRAKVAQPFLGAGRVMGAAATNLAGRAARREPAYPGLRALVAAFYAAVEAGRPSPIPAEQTADVAAARDRLLAEVRRPWR